MDFDLDADLLAFCDNVDLGDFDLRWEILSQGGAADSPTSSTDESIPLVDMPPLTVRKERAATRKIRADTVEGFFAAMTQAEKNAFTTMKVNVPKHAHALTKVEQRDLKVALRKVRNKLSAEDCRQRKIGYMADLETRVDQVTVVNVGLQSRVASLEAENRTLLQQLADLQRKLGLQSLAARGTTLMILGVCLALCWGAPIGAVDNSTFVGGAMGRALKSQSMPLPRAASWVAWDGLVTTLSSWTGFVTTTTNSLVAAGAIDDLKHPADVFATPGAPIVEVNDSNLAAPGNRWPRLPAAHGRRVTSSGDL